MALDPALEFLRQDAESRGLSLHSYARRYGLLTPADFRRIAAHESPLDTQSPVLTDGDAYHCRQCRHRAELSEDD